LTFRRKELEAKQNTGRQDFTILHAKLRYRLFLLFLDYGRKIGGLRPLLVPIGNIEEAMKAIRRFYNGISAKYTDNFVNIALKTRINNERLPQ